MLFPFAEYWWFYGVFILFVLGMLALDLGVFHRKAHAVSFKEAGAWSVFWITLALLFNYGLYRYAGYAFEGSERLLATPGFDPEAAAARVSLEFLTGYLVEKALSVDNIFVFVMVFGYFGIPALYQHRVLFYGILGALVFRAIFIGIGSALVQYHWIVVLFGVFLIFTGLKMLFVSEKPADLSQSPLMRLIRRVLPVTDALQGDRFFVRDGARWIATPLLVSLLFVEVSDVIFAIDSVPAIFAVTREPLIVFTSNIFAILGLRSLFFLLSGAVDKFYLLKYALAFVLVFVGLKMVWLNGLFDGHFPIGISLAIIGSSIAGAIVASLVFPRRPDPESAA